ncbi:DUF2339 domain-containing protein [uncultured Acinetobacter sp.]|uniref:DUF2339 domain-containing protein n=1 Tax=uncultured Acinetobacter sp. TaxID=165433 RepID=UPI0025FC0DE1|nr:DUF2339 domain-containing protein [uncultured Acinetobacter sp.]
MHSQQEQNGHQGSHYRTNSYPTSTSNRYGWLAKLNLFALAGFVLAMLAIDEQGWVCGIGVFFCFILIFVFRALSEQQNMIRFQQRQIQDLIAAQQLNKPTESQAPIAETRMHEAMQSVGKAEQEQKVEIQAPIDNKTSSSFDQHPHVIESANDSGIATSDLDALQIHEQAGISEYDHATVNAELNAQPLSKSYSEINQESDSQQNQQPLLKNSQLKDSDLLKDLKGMTSLWSAFVDWFKGGNSIVRVAIIILFIGIILLLRFASEYWQPTLTSKMLGIAVAGVVLTVVGYRLRHKRYGYAISVQGAGLGILFLVLFSAFKLSVITSVGLSYGLLIVLLAITLLLALRQNALILAFIALGSGFVAPFILNTGSNNIPALFSYYLALNIALAVIAFFKPWRILNTVSLLATFGVGGLSIWMKAQPEQYSILTLLVWLHFALYLFISIRYSLNIAKYKIAFKNIPLIDTGLIFATPFMAFTLYAGLVYHSASRLSLASAVLALVYFAIGYVLHKKYQSLTLLIQSFYGLGLTFFALVLPFALDAQWTSTGWAVQALALIWIGCRHQLKNSVLFGLVLLGLSVGSWFKSIFIDENISLLAVTFLCVALMASLYIFYTPELDESASKSFSKQSIAENDQPDSTLQHKFSSVFRSLIEMTRVIGFIALQLVVLSYSCTLYRMDLLDHSAILMVILTIMAIGIAWRIHQVQQQISTTVQLFAGCGLFYFAMIPVMLWQADIVSLWWTVQAVLMVILTSRYAIVALRNFASIILFSSALAVVVAIFNDDTLRYFSASLLICSLAVSAYWLRYQTRPVGMSSDRIFACMSLLISFLFTPYLAYKLFDLLSWDLRSVTLPMLLWWAMLTLIYRFKQRVLDQAWLFFTVALLLLGTVEIALVSLFVVDDFQFWAISAQYHSAMLMTIIMWVIAFVFVLKAFATQLNRALAQFLMFIAVVLMAIFGGLLASNTISFTPLLLLLPIAVLLASLKIKPFQFLQDYWVNNIAVAGLGLTSLWAVSLFHDGRWNLSYVTLLNPIDLLSIGLFIILIASIKPILQGQQRGLQIASVAVVILTGLMLISSIMLRSLHHFLQLPYWSVDAWQNGTVQASLTILWVVLALILTTFASKKALRHVWMIGIAVLALVIAKLIFLDLSHTHTITRIVSFIGSGLVMLVIGYFAPLPPAHKDVSTENES